MSAIFVESKIFEKLRSDYLSDDDYRELQQKLLARPTAGTVIQGTGGLRKIRIGIKGIGKRGGARVIYYFLDSKSRFYFLTIYAKNEVTDLTSDEKKQLRKFMEDWCNEQT